LQVGQVINVRGAAPTPSAATPTLEPTLEPTPTPTLAPTLALTTTQTSTLTIATSTPVIATPALAQSGLCVSTFDDQNGNGSRDSGEQSVADVEFEVKDANSQVVATYTTDAAPESHCIGNLPDGRYTVSVTSPAGRLATTDANWALSLLSGTAVNIAFGSQIEPVSSPTLEASPTAEAAAEVVSPRSSGAPLGLLVGGALVLLAVAAFAFAISARRRR
jgi:hypothetical protein